MIFCRIVVGIKWECLYKMPATVLAHTCEFFLCVCICFPSVSLHFVLLLFVNLKK